MSETYTNKDLETIRPYCFQENEGLLKMNMKIILSVIFYFLVISSAQAECYKKANKDFPTYSICEFENLTCVSKDHYPEAISCFSTKNWRKK